MGGGGGEVDPDLKILQDQNSTQQAIQAITLPKLTKILTKDTVPTIPPANIAKLTFEQLYVIIGDATKAIWLTQGQKDELVKSSTIIQVAGSGNVVTFAGNGYTDIGLTFAGITKANIVGGVYSSYGSGYKDSWSLVNAGSVTLNSIKGSVTIGGNTLQFGASGNNVKFTVNSGGSVKFDEDPNDPGNFRDLGTFFVHYNFLTVTISSPGNTQVSSLVINTITINSIEFNFSKVSISNPTAIYTGANVNFDGTPYV